MMIHVGMTLSSLKPSHRSSDKCVTRLLYQLNHSHLCVISSPCEGLCLDTSVASVTISVSLLHSLKQPLDKHWIVDKSKGLSASMKRTVFCQRDHMVDILANDLGLDLRETTEVRGLCCPMASPISLFLPLLS